MAVGSQLRSLITPPQAKRLDTRNLRTVMPEKFFPSPPDDPAEVAGEVAQAQAKAPEDVDLWANYAVGGAVPVEQTKLEAFQHFGSAEARDAYTRALYESLRGKPTQAYDNSITAGIPTYHTTAPVASRKYGQGGKTAMTLVTPQQLLDNLTGDPAHSAVFQGRIQERNLPDGQGGAEIYHFDDVAEAAQSPWLIFRDSANQWGKRGYSKSPESMIFMDRAADPGLDAPKMMRSQPLNIAEHEGIHSILHPKVWTPDFQERLDKRPLLLDIADPKQASHPYAKYLGSSSVELQNAFVHAKRMTEAINPQMRDVGESADSLDAWLEYMKRYQGGYGDPTVTKPGHYLEGQPARGYNRLMEALQQIERSLGPDGKQDLRNMNFKTSATNPIREALLA